MFSPMRALVLCLAVAVPAAARGGLLDEGLAAPDLAEPDLAARPAVLLAAAGSSGKAKAEKEKAAKPTPAPAASPDDLDFDLLGEAKAPADAPDPAAMKRRRQQLSLHQGVGMGLLALQIGTTVVGQLNYRDKFATHANTEKWRMPHKVLAYTTTGVFLIGGALALTAPAPVKRPTQLDRVTAHRIAMFAAALGMATQIGLGLYTHSREGYQNQQDLAKAHLYIGYGTLACMLVGVGVLVF